MKFIIQYKCRGYNKIYRYSKITSYDDECSFSKYKNILKSKENRLFLKI